MIDLTSPIYQDENKAREHLEAIRWPEGPFCPHCGEVEAITKLQGKSTRPGVYKCRSCRKPFTVTVGTVFERSKISLCKWLMATHLLCASKKGMSAHQLHRMLGVTYKTAWFMAHRIREAMREGSFTTPMGGAGKHVEADETYIGGKAKNRAHRRGALPKKEAIVSLVERGGMVRSFHVKRVTAKELRKTITFNVDPATTLQTDQWKGYRPVGRLLAQHEAVNHSVNEYVRGTAYTNTVENYFSILKRGLYGTYQHVAKHHLKRYVGEFDFRYNTRTVTDAERAHAALKGIEGKRLTYRRIGDGAYF